MPFREIIRRYVGRILVGFDVKSLIYFASSEDGFGIE